MNRMIITVMLILTVTATSKDPFCATDSNGKCSPNLLPGKYPNDFQSFVLNELKPLLQDNHYRRACYLVRNDEPPVRPVYFYYSCAEGLSEHDCYICYLQASVQLTKVCTGRAGGVVSYVGCCLRYELYKICQD